MVKRDDAWLREEQVRAVREHARKVLERADALGCFPTPIDQILESEEIFVAPDNIFDDGFIKKMVKKAGGLLKTAISKVVGLFDALDRTIFINTSLPKPKIPFLKLHEAGHAVMPWQAKMYKIVQDCDQTLDPEISEQFDSEANRFATEVLFQLDSFGEMANSYEFGIKAPLKAGKKFGASAYSSVRRYVKGSRRPCMVVVLNPPSPSANGFDAEVRRYERSDEFVEMFGQVEFSSNVTPESPLGFLVPLGDRRMSGTHTFYLKDLNGDTRQCVAEAFATPYQVFILIFDIGKLRAKRHFISTV